AGSKRKLPNRRRATHIDGWRSSDLTPSGSRRGDALMGDGAVVVVGGTRGIGLELVRHYAESGREVVLHGGSDTVADAVAEAGGNTRGLTFDLADPHSIRPALADVGPVDRLALVAIDRDQNTIADYDIHKALHLVKVNLGR